MNKLLKIQKKKVINLCKEMKVEELYVFSPITSENFYDNSDIDILISFMDDVSLEKYTNYYFNLHYKLEEIFKRKTDLTTERSLSNPFFIDTINTNKLLVDAA